MFRKEGEKERKKDLLFVLKIFQNRKLPFLEMNINFVVDIDRDKQNSLVGGIFSPAQSPVISGRGPRKGARAYLCALKTLLSWETMHEFAC